MQQKRNLYNAGKRNIPMQLIPLLKEQHVEIKYVLDEIKENIKKKDSECVSNCFNKLMNILIPHLNIEDRLLYPFFEKAKQEELKKLGNMFAVEMTKIVYLLNQYLKKYNNEKLEKLIESKEFKTETKELFNKIETRVTVEENILFPAYEKYHTK